MILDLKLCVLSFVVSVLINLQLPLQLDLLLSSTQDISPLPLYSKVGEILCLLILSNKNKVTCLTSYCLGLVFLTGLHNISSPVGLYLIILSSFHCSEFIATGLSNPNNLSWDSFLVNHSVQYWVAMLVSWIEYWLWTLMFPGIKSLRLISFIGLVLAVTGEIIRKTAMIQAGRNFNHIVQSEKHADHQLVTSGVYSCCRHPSYAGWFLWSVATQVLLINPVCMVLYALASYFFFRERIYVEEFTLLSFFGDQYRQYQQRVWSGVPGVEGYLGRVWGENK